MARMGKSQRKGLDTDSEGAGCAGGGVDSSAPPTASASPVPPLPSPSLPPPSLLVVEEQAPTVAVAAAVAQEKSPVEVSQVSAPASTVEEVAVVEVVHVIEEETHQQSVAAPAAAVCEESKDVDDKPSTTAVEEIVVDEGEFSYDSSHFGAADSNEDIGAFGAAASAAVIGGATPRRMAKTSSAYVDFDSAYSRKDSTVDFTESDLVPAPTFLYEHEEAGYVGMSYYRGAGAGMSAGAGRYDNNTAVDGDAEKNENKAKNTAEFQLNLDDGCDVDQDVASSAATVPTAEAMLDILSTEAPQSSSSVESGTHAAPEEVAPPSAFSAMAKVVEDVMKDSEPSASVEASASNVKADGKLTAKERLAARLAKMKEKS